MLTKLKSRKVTQYCLIFSTLFIQILILLFFYNEYYNENKLTDIRKQMEQVQQLKLLTSSSKQELFNAQNILFKYIENPSKELLNSYFNTLHRITNSMDSFGIRENSILKLGSDFHTRANYTEVKKLESLIDSVYKHSGSLKLIQKTESTHSFSNEDLGSQVIVEEKVISDSVRKKKLFPRLRDALLGKTNVKTDTVYITTTYVNELDTARVKEEMDSAFKLINDELLLQEKRYKIQLMAAQSKNQHTNRIYYNLISLANNLIGQYDSSASDIEAVLIEQYQEGLSNFKNIRKLSLIGLMFLLLIVLLILGYYTILSFRFEKQLRLANESINRNLIFKNRILGMLSHEIRSPLKMMNLFINKLSKNANDAQAIEVLRSMRFTNDSLILQANQILNYAKNQELKMTLTPINFDLYRELNSILTSFNDYIESANNFLDIEIDMPDNAVVYADRSKIHQIFINLLGNANKFTENGSIKVIIKTIPMGSNVIRLTATISDTGVGISERDINMIFEPYYKGIIAENVENLGAGLGLNLCKEIIELFGGIISVESELGKGTTFKFEIDLNMCKE